LIKILVIENQEDNLTEVESILPQEEFSVHFSHSKKDGIRIAGRYQPRVILFLYYSAEDLSLIQKFLHNEKTRTIPIIAISEQPSLSESRVLLTLGVDDYMGKSEITQTLETTLRNRLSKLHCIKKKFNEEFNSFEDSAKPIKHDDHILVKLGTKLKFVKFTEILCIKALKEYSKVKTVDGMELLVRKTMRNWTKILPESSFLRIHRATIINLDFVEKVSQINNRTYTAKLKGCETSFDFSYRYANIMRRTFPM